VGLKSIFSNTECRKWNLLNVPERHVKATEMYGTDNGWITVISKRATQAKRMESL
jgi:hypothetical protein